MMTIRSRTRTAAPRPTWLAAILVGGFFLSAAQPAAAEPALWKVRGPHATIYLFGTIHLLRADTVWHSPKIDAAFASAGTLYEELANVDDPSAFGALAARYGRDPAHTLSSRLNAGGKAKLAAVAERLGAPIEQLESLRPWLAAIGLSSLPLIRAGFDPASGVDVKLRALAGVQHKRIAGFETLEQQLRGLADLPERTQIQFLLSTLDDAERGAASLDRMVAAWSAGDVATVQTLTVGSIKLRYSDLYRRLFVERNRAFAAQIETLLKGDGVTFVAIGAGHLAGPDSVQADLARDGIIAKRL